MEVFISWSGPLGKSIADALRNWLPAVIQAVKPFYSPDDIAKGRHWNSELNKRLKAARVGIIVVTKECLDAPWLLFEAGAIANNFDEAHVCPVLFGIHTPEVTGPLLQFQITSFDRTEIRKLLDTINRALSEARLENEVLDNVFEIFWPRLDRSIREILEQEPQEKRTHPLRSDRELLEEVLNITRKMYQHSGSPVPSTHHDTDARPQVVSFDSEYQTICLNIGIGMHTYDISLSQIDSGAEIVDFIFQIAHKGWSGPDHIYQFVKMIEDLAQSAFNSNAQGVFCPMGSNKVVAWPEHVEL